MMKKFNDTFLRAIRGEQIDHVPVWYMRQAGRYQAEYREIKKTRTLFEITHDSELGAYVTELPVKQLGVDAAILYKDIMTPLPSMGVDVEIKSGIGPVIANPIRTMADVEALQPFNREDIPYIYETIRLLRERLEVPLIGFSGAPFTLASYMIEGGPSKGYHKTKALMYGQPEVWHALMEKLGDMVIDYIKSQVDAGIQAFQIFDSWVGTTSRKDYVRYIKPTMERIFTELKDTGVPMIMFGVGASHLAEEWHSLPLDVVGLDWRLSIDEARERGLTKPVQGNLDPSYLLAPWDILEAKTKEILDMGMKQPGFIFNLGHGIFPEVDPEVLKRLTAFIHDYSKEKMEVGK
ncbi:uroporphyrinogen decarboxylase [Exiguobacterium sp. Leaf187]|uniref:Uroporphyrinogen decarboxylase n=2 Tax=Exiguobacterium TaxID=33986 RepID=A0A0V8GFT3_9BACL|nr:MULTISPECIES: uroporphyrinogen decarboxylase [Exiguobacterium]AHA29008.1 uroporphyrinogen decarboxylase [Exiguobacterium sp. MH3]AOS99857.1 uroporphyrinogen decarboxylase [Exiguobacterium sp. U13-1]KNH36020.1 uroporphyrinogen decarboxylase [Exiguobacterium acetylicum]KQS20619.1 uroporphyrinogen decarboxylase [Exiguobacterium sp. Leaf187]KSU49042.1 uroporphyrinogen decarboxylase [Exiguobacterium enclense]